MSKPMIRFEGFNDDWEKKKLGDIADRFDNLRKPITASDRVSGNTPYYGANGIQDYVDGHTHSGGNILIAEDGANDVINYPVRYVEGDIWVNNHAHVLQAKPQVSDSQYMAYMLKTFNFIPYLLGSGRYKLNAGIMMKLPVIYPTLPEQELIGNFFKTIDDLILAQEQAVKTYGLYKEAMLQKMFPKKGQVNPDLRFEGFSDDWEETKLGDIFGRKSEKGRSDLPLITVSEEETNIRSAGAQGYSTDTSTEALENAKIVLNGEFLIDLTSYSRGIYMSRMDGLTSNAYNVLELTEGDHEYWARYFVTHNFVQSLKRLTPPGARQGKMIEVPSLLLDKVPTPSLEEQTLIGNFFKSLDETIGGHQSKLDQYKEMKESFLQKMFVK